ncbi:MAG TPA: ANTAR domain-containing protein [Pseudonocardiaceae bacterium]|nr:ANTAR domain-containing protein [Pseudonocardiaceae bacterium]
MSAIEPAESDALRRRVHSLERAMHSRAVIEQAIGVLAATHGADPETAFRYLVRLSQHRNIKLRRLAAVLIELTAEAGAETAAGIVQRLDSGDPLIELASERNRKRGAGPDELVPAAVVEAARELVAARDAADPADPDRDGATEDRLRDARTSLYAELIRLGWVPPFPVPTELAEAVGEFPLAPEQSQGC